MTDSEIEDLKPILKSELRKKYDVKSANTFRKYLASVPGLNISNMIGNGYIMPNELILIYNHLGRP